MKRSVLRAVRTAMAFAALAIATACNETETVTEKGGLAFSLQTDSRSEVTPAKSDLSPRYGLTIRRGNAIVQRYSADEAVPATVWLLCGAYRITAEAGDNPDFALNAPYFKGEKEVTVTADVVTDAEIVCTLANAKVSVLYSDAVLRNFDRFQTTVRNAKGAYTFEEAASDLLFVKVATPGQNYLNWEINLRNKDGETYKKSGKIEELTARNHYILNVDIDDNYEDGGLIVEIGIDTDAPVTDKEILIPLKRLPEITGLGFDLANPVFIAKNTDPDVRIDLKGWPEIASVQLTHDCALFRQAGIPETVELTQMSAGGILALEEAGFSWVQEADNTILADLSALGARMSRSSEESEWNAQLTFSVRSSSGKEKSATVTLNVINSDVVTLASDNALRDIWPTSAVLWGRWVTDDRPAAVGFEYRKAADNEWRTAEGEITVDNASRKFQVKVTGLEPNTKYQYRAKAGEVYANNVTFTSDYVVPLTNGNLDQWHQNGKVWNPWPQSGSRFWDSGNSAVTTITNSTTTPSDAVAVEKPEGGKAAQLQSTYADAVIYGKFAAGNLFTGQFMGIDGTDGVLQFGQPFTGRPTRLKGYYKYRSGSINYASSSNPDLRNLKGTPDECHIFIALTNWASPLEIRTKTSDRQLFDKNDPGIIAYQELISPASSEEYLELDLPLVYRMTDQRPAYIVVVATASRYGDYFTGSTDSRLLLDELELVYE